MWLRLSLFILLSFLPAGFCYARPQVATPDTILIRTDKGDTTVFEGLDDDDQRRYNSAVRRNELRQRPIEQINDREAFAYFEIGDSLQYFISKLGSKKVHLSHRGYQLTFPDELFGTPQVIEYQFWDDGLLHGIERITDINSLPTNDVWTAFQLIEIIESLSNLENAIKILRSKTARRPH